MVTLKTQYENYRKENPNSELTYDEWFEQLIPYVSDDFQIGPDGAYEHNNDLSIWDNTLLDGLEEYINDLDKTLITICMLGFNDKLNNQPLICDDGALVTLAITDVNGNTTTCILNDIPIILRAYNLGMNYATIGDDMSFNDYKTKCEILNKIYNK